MSAQDAPSLDAAHDGGTTGGWPSLFRDGNALVSVMITGGVAIHAQSMRVVATTLPSVVMDIGGLRFFAWTTTVAIVSAIWGAAFSASLVRARGLRHAYRVSLTLFAAGSVACAMAPDMGVFLIGRVLQGLGGGLLTSLSYTTIQRVFRENMRTRAIVFLSGVWGVAAFSGPLIGGVFAGLGFWRGAFWVDVPLAVTVWAMAEYSLPRSRQENRDGVLGSARTVCTRLALLAASALAVSVGGVSGDPLSSAVGLVVGAALLMWLLRLEQASSAAAVGFHLLPSGAYRPDNVLGAVSLSMALMIGTTSAVLYLPYLATEVGGYPPVVGGYLSSLFPFSWTAAAFVTASAESKWAERSILFGPIAMTLGSIGIAGALVAGSFQNVTLATVALGLILIGGGVGIAWAHLIHLMMTHAKKEEHDVSSGFIYTNQMIATAFASGLAGMIVNLAGFANHGLGPNAAVHAVAWVFSSFSTFAAAALLVSILAVRMRRSTELPVSPAIGATK
jgi:MFS family permease